LTKIFYFSGTGNTLWSAKKIAEIIGGECLLINIGLEAQKNEIILEADAVVLLFPAYAYGMPIVVRDFVKKAVFKTPYVAAFVTYGTSPGGTMASLSRILKKKRTEKFSGAAFFGRIPAVENYIAIFGPQSEKTIQRRLAMQTKATEEAARCVTEKRTGKINTFRPFSAFISLLFAVIGIRIFYKHYRVSAECDGCGICEKVCPVAAVSFREKRPVFSAKCEHCQACLNWCPKKAIRFGRLNARIPRYHHPDITVTDMER
jgi:ferredoxin/flavodoxin